MMDWKTTFDAFPEAICLTDVEMRVTWMNEAARRTLRSSLEDALGRPLQTVINRHRTGKTIKLTTCPLYDESGKTNGALCLIYDFTESRRAEEALQESEKRYRELVDAIQEGLGVVDEREMIRFCNPAFARILEVPAEELVGRSLGEFVDEESWQRILNQTTIRRANRESVYELMIRTGKGNQRQIMVCASPRFGAAGEYLGAFGLLQDITERKEAERDRERLVQELAQRVKELSCIYSISHAMETLDSIPELLQEIVRHIPPGTALPEKTHAAISLDGQTLEVNSCADAATHELEAPITVAGVTRGKVVIRRGEEYPFSDNEGKLLGRIAESIQRFVVRQELQERLLFAQKMESLATLSRGIAHDFNNLMVGVLGSVALLRDHIGASSSAASHLETIEDSATHAGVLARELLTYAQGTESRPTLADLNETIRDVLSLQGRDLSSRACIECDLDSKLDTIEADPIQIQQVLINLCTNATEAMPRGGRIHLTTCNFQVDSAFADAHPGLKPGPHVLLTVEDEGCGMSAETLSRMFEPFYSTKFDGRGLGLAVVYGIVKNHRGYVTARSETGKGTTILVFFPAIRRAHPAAPKAEAVGAKEPQTVLLIDDEAVVLDITRQLLERTGYRVLVACNGREAVDIAETHRGDIAIALLDIGMPVMDGYEAFPLLRKRRPEMKIVVCSGYAANGPGQELIDAGAAGFIQKPFTLDSLLGAIETALEARPAQ
jgi:two-component system cell cycle sensor histidine kinase/response regulator CckA